MQGGKHHQRSIPWKGYLHSGAHAQAAGSSPELRCGRPLISRRLNSSRYAFPISPHSKRHQRSKPKVCNRFIDRRRSSGIRPNAAAPLGRRGRLASRLAVQQIGRGVDGRKRRGMQMTTASGVMVTDGRRRRNMRRKSKRREVHVTTAACCAAGVLLIPGRVRSGSRLRLVRAHYSLPAAIIPAAALNAVHDRRRRGN